MTDRPPAFATSSFFVVSALTVLASLSVMSLGLHPGPQGVRHPTVAELLLQHRALEAAAEDARVQGFDLSEMECEISEDNARWIEYSRHYESDFPGEPLASALHPEPYWAIYFCPKREPGSNVKDGDVWVFVRRSDFRVLGRL